MTRAFDDPHAKAALAAAGVVHKPGMARDVLRDLAPFLAEEGVDLDRPVVPDLETLNAALARATASDNQSLPAARLPKLTQADRSLVREFRQWLHRQPESAAPSPGDEADLFSELLRVARQQSIRLRTPAGVEDLVALLLDDGPVQDDATAAAVETLHDYVHFQRETSVDPVAWEEIHDLFDDPLPGAEILEAAIVEGDELPLDERRAALAATQLVAKVTELLSWVGSGRKVAPSGGVRRADIATAAGFLGIAAVGVDRMPRHAPDTPALIEMEPDPSASSAIHARSMKDVPLLPSWWRALMVAELIEVRGTMVGPGPSAAGWTAEPTPPLEAAETVVGVSLCEYVCEDMGNRSAIHAGPVAAMTVARLLAALDSQVTLTLDDGDDFDRHIDARARKDLDRLARVGLLTGDTDQGFVVPAALRSTVARGVLAAIAVLGGATDLD